MKRGLKQGIEAAMMAVQISTVVLREKSRVSLGPEDVVKTMTYQMVRSVLSNKKSPYFP